MKAVYELDTLPALGGDEVMDVLRQVGLISAGAVGGMVIKDQVLCRFLDNPLYCTLAELGLGVAGAAAAASNRKLDMLFWPAVGVGVHAMTALLEELLGKFGFMPGASTPAGSTGGGGAGGALV